MVVKRIFLIVSISLNLLLVSYLLFSENGVGNYQILRADIAGLTEHQISLDERAYALSQEIRLLQSDSGYIEKVVRERLGFVKGNEILYIFPDSTKKKFSGAHE